jgi:ATP dependent DNA ligase domain
MNRCVDRVGNCLVDEPFNDKNWVFEIKWDGFRLITEKRNDAVRLWSRNGIDATKRYQLLAPALRKIEGSCLLDGELCALVGLRDAEIVNLAHGVRLLIDAYAKGMHLAHRFEYDAWHADFGEA